MKKIFSILAISQFAAAATYHFGIDNGYYLYKEWVDSKKFVENRGLLTGIYASIQDDYSKKFQLESSIKVIANDVLYDGGYHTENGTKKYNDNTFYLIINNENLVKYKCKHFNGFMPYTGLGYRWLKNSIKTNTQLNLANMKRFETYLYMPVGIEKDGLRAEARFLLQARNKTVISGSNPIPYMTQHKGIGFAAEKSFNLNKSLVTSIYGEYWSIEDSDIVRIAPNQGYMEPKNKTYRFGLKVLYKL